MVRPSFITEILAMSPADRVELLAFLQETVDSDGQLTLDEESQREVDRRIDEFERLGSRGQSADDTFSQLLTDLRNASRNRH